MATMNQVQFQPGMSITKFMELYGSQEQCELALEKCRWHDGFICPICARKEHYVVWHGNAKTFQCKACRSQTTLTSGTIFHSSKLPLTKWFQATYFLTQAKNNVAALELMRLVGVCYRTAWRLKHKIKRVGCGMDATLDVTIGLTVSGAGDATATLDSSDGTGAAMVYHLDLKK